MDFRLTDEQLEFQQKCRKFATEVIRPVAAEHDREQSVPWEVIKEAQKWNLAGLDLVQEMGMDEGGLKGVIYAEELHFGCAGIALAISASGARRRRHRGIGHARADRPLGAGVLRRAATRSSSAPTRSPRPAPAPTSSRCARPRSATATSGS